MPVFPLLMQLEKQWVCDIQEGQGLVHLTLVLNAAYFCCRVTDERLLLSCCSHVAEWLVTAENGDSTFVSVPDGMFFNKHVFVIELLVKLNVSYSCAHFVFVAPPVGD